MRPGESDDDLILRLAGSGEPREGQNRRRGGFAERQWLDAAALWRALPEAVNVADDAMRQLGS